MCVSWRPHINLTLPDTEVRSISVRFFLARLIQRAAEHMWSSSLSIWASLTFFWRNIHPNVIFPMANSAKFPELWASELLRKGSTGGNDGLSFVLNLFCLKFSEELQPGMDIHPLHPFNFVFKNSDLKRSQHISLLIMLTGVFISCISCILYLQWGDAGGGHVTSQS